MILSEAQSRLLRLVSYRREPRGESVARLLGLGFSARSFGALMNAGLARSINDRDRLVSTTKGEVQIVLEDERIARLVRRARKRGNP